MRALALVLLATSTLAACTDGADTSADAGAAPPDAAGGLGADGATGLDRPAFDARVDAGPRDQGTRDAEFPDARPYTCADQAPLPLTATARRLGTSSEDFAFDSAGNVVASDDLGNLVTIDPSGRRRLFVPNAAEFIAGIRYLPSGDLIYLDAALGDVVRVSPSGSRRVILSGLLYPNGLEIGLDGQLYLTEQTGGRIRRVDPDSGAFTILASGLRDPNGLSFAPDYRTLYFGTFGTGQILALHLDAEGRTSTITEFAREPDVLEPALVPTQAELLAACVAAAEGAPCTVPAAEQLGLRGSCYNAAPDSPQPIGYCGLEYPDDLTPCTGEQAGDPCGVTWRDVVYPGVCRSHGFPVDVVPQPLACTTTSSVVPTATRAMKGGLDGMGVDACGQVYVSEYVRGVIWRISPDGQTWSRLFEGGAPWMPNMQWGSGIGPWDSQTLYVIGRDTQALYEVPVGVPSKPR